MHIVVRETNVTTNLSPDSRRRFIPHHILESMRSKAGGLIATNLSLASGCFLYDYLVTSPLSRIFFRLFTKEINPAIANNPKPIGMIEMQYVTIYPNIYECVSDYMKMQHDRF